MTKTYTNINVAAHFNTNQTKRKRFWSRQNAAHQRQLHENITLQSIIGQFNNDYTSIHDIRTTIFQLPKYKLHEILEEARRKTIDIDIPFNLLCIIIDLATTKLYIPTLIQEMKKPKKHFLKIYFHNKGIEQLHLPSILRDKRLKQNIPEYFNDKEAPQICYKYTKPIAQSIFNYNKAVSDFDKESFDAMSCECEGSEFVDEHHGHIITGDLTIVEDQGLQSLLLKGPKFREENQICWNYNKHIIFTALECYKKAWAKREGVETSALDDYFEAAKTLVKNKVSYLKRNNHKDQPDKLLSQEATKSALEDLHSKFV